MKSVLVSALVPAYNHAPYLGSTLRSLIAQTYARVQLVLFNDGSTDATRAEIQKLLPDCNSRFERFKFIDKPNEGLARTLNRGLQICEGEYIFHLASDDTVEPDAIEKLVNVAKANPDAGQICGDADFMDAQGTPLLLRSHGCSYCSFVQFFTRGHDDFNPDTHFGTYPALLWGNHVPVGLLVPKFAHDTVGPYPENSILEDYGFWLRLSKEYRFVFLREVLAHYRIHNSNTSRTRAHELLLEELHLIFAEREYCRAAGYENLWKRKMAQLTYRCVSAGLIVPASHHLRNAGLSELLKYTFRDRIQPAVRRMLGNPRRNS